MVIEKRKIGRPKKKEYDEALQFKRLLDGVDYCYECTGEIKATAEELGLSTTKVKKLLITSEKIKYDETSQIQRLLQYGKNLNEIQQELGLKKSSINSYLPYSKIPYKSEEISSNADRCELYRKRKTAVEEIKDEETLCTCLDLFSGYNFYLLSGKKFSYNIIKDNDIADASDVHSIELFIDIENKGITRSSVCKAYEKTLSLDTVNEPSDLGDFFGVQYLYSIFYRFKLFATTE